MTQEICVLGILLVPGVLVAYGAQLECLSDAKQKGFRDPVTSHPVACFDGPRDMCKSIFRKDDERREVCHRQCCAYVHNWSQPPETGPTPVPSPQTVIGHEECVPAQWKTAAIILCVLFLLSIIISLVLFIKMYYPKKKQCIVQQPDEERAEHELQRSPAYALLFRT